jgi:hypothetical protein
MIYDSIVAKAAYTLWQHMPDACTSFTVTSTGARHVLVDYSPVLLRNIGEHELADRLAAATASRAGVAWIMVHDLHHGDHKGVVNVKEAALASHAQEVINKFEARASNEG